MSARVIMIQGTASSVGKSLLVAALCRFFRREGVRVAPFKAQNMALNSAVTPDGLEIGRAQAVQAEAAGIPASVEMNPILLKPEGNGRCQIVVRGKPRATTTASDDERLRAELITIIADSLTVLRQRYDLIVIEGAGSPAEVNLKGRDLANMHVARVADSPVLLVGDIDRGGVFASLVGTLELLDADERERVAALVINKFRGDVNLLRPGIDFLETRTQKPVLGIVPFVSRLRIADEDSVALDERPRPEPAAETEVDIAVVRLPRISNHDDFTPLEHVPGVVLRFTDAPEELRRANLVILPGSKSTVPDLEWLRASGIAGVIEARARRGEPILGICGGCQMLGEIIEDPHHIESSRTATPGLGLLALRTRFERTKITARVEVRVAHTSFLSASAPSEELLHGYEIHMGIVEQIGDTIAPFRIISRNGDDVTVRDGAVGSGGSVVGTMIHGLFENASVRAGLLRFLRQRRGRGDGRSAISKAGAGDSLHVEAVSGRVLREAEYDRLEAVVRDSLDQRLLWSISRLR